MSQNILIKLQSVLTSDSVHTDLLTETALTLNAFQLQKAQKWGNKMTKSQCSLLRNETVFVHRMMDNTVFMEYLIRAARNFPKLEVWEFYAFTKRQVSGKFLWNSALKLSTHFALLHELFAPHYHNSQIETINMAKYKKCIIINW